MPSLPNNSNKLITGLVVPLATLENLMALKKYFSFVYIILCVCVYLCERMITWMQWQWNPEESFISPGAGVSKLPDMSAGNRFLLFSKSGAYS